MSTCTCRRSRETDPHWPSCPMSTGRAPITAVTVDRDGIGCRVVIPGKLEVHVFEAAEDGTPAVEIRHLHPDTDPLVVWVDGRIVVNRP